MIFILGLLLIQCPMGSLHASSPIEEAEEVEEEEEEEEGFVFIPNDHIEEIDEITD